ncbi:hypothetical protein [Spirosoma daeguense]
MKKSNLLLSNLFCLCLLVLTYQANAQILPELRQYISGGRIEAEITTVKNCGNRFTSYAKCVLRYASNKLSGNYQQLFSYRNQFMGDKDNTGIEIDLSSVTITIILNSWGGGRETYQAQVQSNG